MDEADVEPRFKGIRSPVQRHRRCGLIFIEARTKKLKRQEATDTYDSKFKWEWPNDVPVVVV